MKREAQARPGILEPISISFMSRVVAKTGWMLGVPTQPSLEAWQGGQQRRRRAAARSRGRRRAEEGPQRFAGDLTSEAAVADGGPLRPDSGRTPIVPMGPLLHLAGRPTCGDATAEACKGSRIVAARIARSRVAPPRYARRHCSAVRERFWSATLRDRAISAQGVVTFVLVYVKYTASSAPSPAPK